MDFPPTLRSLFPYAAAILAAAVSLVIGTMLFPLLGVYAPFVVLLPSVALCVAYLGSAPSILTTALVFLGAIEWFALSAPTSAASVSSEAATIPVLLFAAGVIIAFGELNRRKLDIVRKAHGELEDCVKQRTAELDEANTSLRDLTARVLHLQDEERRHLARELHDGIGQGMAALTMNLSAVKEDIERLQRTASTVSDSASLVQEMGDGIRTISHLLHPPLLDECGLSTAVRWYAEGFAKRSNIIVDLEFPEDFGRLPQDLETTLFRVLQECLTNIHRHSESPTATIRASRSADEVCLEVEDSGKGLSPEKLAEMASSGSVGVGIRGMRERIRQLNGTLEVISDGDGKGTTVTMRLPIAEVATMLEPAKLSAAAATD